ncbi:MAG: hypothetical protein ACRYG4_10985 [Janthinobacterium lividum]
MIATILCLVLGDSIAKALAATQPQCESVATNGANSDQVAAAAPPDRPYARVIVSVGSNDRGHSRLPENLAFIRARYPAAEFIWIVPRKPVPGGTVAGFARHHHDLTVMLADFPSHDGTHPLDYRAVASRLPDRG